MHKTLKDNLFFIIYQKWCIAFKNKWWNVDIINVQGFQKSYAWQVFTTFCNPKRYFHFFKWFMHKTLKENLFFKYKWCFIGFKLFLEVVKTTGDSWDYHLQDPKILSTFVDLWATNNVILGIIRGWKWHHPILRKYT